MVGKYQDESDYFCCGNLIDFFESLDPNGKAHNEVKSLRGVNLIRPTLKISLTVFIGSGLTYL